MGVVEKETKKETCELHAGMIMVDPSWCSGCGDYFEDIESELEECRNEERELIVEWLKSLDNSRHCKLDIDWTVNCIRKGEHWIEKSKG